MYDNYEILHGGWNLPDPAMMKVGTVIKDVDTEDKYISVFNPANLKEAGKASKRRKIFSEIEKAAAWAAFIPIVGAGLRIWSEYGEEETVIIFDIWEKIDNAIILFGVTTLALFTVSMIAGMLEKKYSRASKKHLKSSFSWKVISEDRSEAIASLAGLAKTEEELRLMKKEAKLEAAIGESLDIMSEEKKHSEPISESEYRNGKRFRT